MVVSGWQASAGESCPGGYSSLLDVHGMDSKRILEVVHITYFCFLWSGKQESQVTPWVRWERIAISKGLGGWGLKK